MCPGMRKPGLYTQNIPFILQYVSPLMFKILETYKLHDHEISYEKLHRWITPMSKVIQV